MPNSAPPQFDRIFVALADPYRRRLVEQLGRGPASVSSLAAGAEVGLPAVLKHLRILEDGGIVVSRKTGRVRTYCMRPDAFAAVNRWIAERQRELNEGFDRLAAQMAELPEEEAS